MRFRKGRLAKAWGRVCDRRGKSAAGFTLIEFGAAVGLIGLLSVGAGQTVKYDVLLLPAVRQANISQCSVRVAVYNQNGQMMSSAPSGPTGAALVPNGPQTLMPNHSASFTFTAQSTGDGSVDVLHALVVVPMCPDGSRSCSQDQQDMQRQCAMNPAGFAGDGEVMNTNTIGGTAFLLPYTRMNPAIVSN
jgi:type II secretory pathway pseudopilin PulG